DDNRSWNHGVEGETDDPEVIALRDRQRRNLIATVLISQGCPMLLGGDEMGHTQGGNNNTYCQDNEISWLDWEHVDEDMLAFTRQAMAVSVDTALSGQAAGGRWWRRGAGLTATTRSLVVIRPASSAPPAD